MHFDRHKNQNFLKLVIATAQTGSASSFATVNDSYSIIKRIFRSFHSIGAGNMYRFREHLNCDCLFARESCNSIVANSKISNILLRTRGTRFSRCRRNRMRGHTGKMLWKEAQYTGKIVYQSLMATRNLFRRNLFLKQHLFANHLAKNKICFTRNSNFVKFEQFFPLKYTFCKLRHPETLEKIRSIFYEFFSFI